MNRPSPKSPQPSREPSVRWGLCCAFQEAPIKFRTTTAAACGRLPRDAARAKLGRLCRENAEVLLAALKYCAAQGIGAFRITSQILPLRTHPELGYELADLPEGPAAIAMFRRCGAFVKQAGLRTLFHPDQFVVLSSPRAEVVASSAAELDYQAEVAEWVGADVINLHVGGAYGDKAAALDRFFREAARLPERVRSRLTVENDDKLYAPRELAARCRAEGVPLIYDVHHHRCLPDGWTTAEATAAALATWNREPVLHLSSPHDGWGGARPERHADFIDPRDFPQEWREIAATIEVEARAKEIAIARLREQLTTV